MPGQFDSPADLIRSVRMRRGDDPGPAAGVTIHDPNILEPVVVDDEADPGLVEEAARPDEPRYDRHAGRPDGLDRDRGHDDLHPTPTSGEGVSLSKREGWFQGHHLQLNESEARALKTLLARVALRQLRDERKRLKEV